MSDMSDMSDKNDLMHLKTEVGDAGDRGSDQGPHTQPPREGKVPLLGLFAVGFGLLGIFTFAPVFVPLALIFGIIAVFMGQIGLGILALFLSVIGVITSPTFMAVIGIGAFLAWLGF